MALPAIALYAMGAASALLAVSAVLFFLSLGRSFEMLRARLFLKFRLYEKFFVAVGAVALALAAVDFWSTLFATATLDLVPDVPARVVMYSAVIALYREFYRSLRGAGEAAGRGREG